MSSEIDPDFYPAQQLVHTARSEQLAQYVYENLPLDAEVALSLATTSPNARQAVMRDLLTAPRPYDVGPQTAEEAGRELKMRMLINRSYKNPLRSGALCPQDERDGLSGVRPFTSHDIPARSANRSGLATARRDYEGSLGGGSPGNASQVNTSRK